MDTLKIPLESLYDKIQSMYKLVVLASMRALELNAGAAQLTEQESNNVLLTALHEIQEEKITYAQIDK